MSNAFKSILLGVAGMTAFAATVLLRAGLADAQPPDLSPEGRVVAHREYVQLVRFEADGLNCYAVITASNNPGGVWCERRR